MGRTVPHPVPSSSSRASRPSSKPPSSALPLLTWERDREAALLERRRTELRRRIGALKPRSYARIVAEAELKALTLEALRRTTP